MSHLIIICLILLQNAFLFHFDEFFFFFFEFLYFSLSLSLDNSEWMRNGDYTPNRLGAQNDAVLLLADAKTQANQESTVGIMTYAGKRFFTFALNFFIFFFFLKYSICLDQKF